MKHRNSFDALRLIAAALVIIGHSWPVMGILKEPAIGGVAINVIGCMMFFALSGYLISKSIRADEGRSHAYRRFVWNRALRIMPALIAVIVVATFVVGPLTTQLASADYWRSILTWKYFCGNLALWTEHKLPGVFQNNPYPYSVNTSLWTLPIEVTMYLLTFPMVATRRWRGWAVALSAIAVAMSAAYDLGPWFSLRLWAYNLHDALTYMPSYVVGAIFAGLDLDKISEGGSRASIVGSAVALTILTVSPSGSGAAILFLPISGLTLFIGVSRMLHVGLIERIGDLSYGLYLWGFLVQQCLAHLFGHRLTPGSLAPMALAISAILAWLSWHLIERRALKFKLAHRPALRTGIAQSAAALR